MESINYKNERDLLRLKEIIDKLELSSEELYDLYTMSVMDRVEEIKNKLIGDKLELVLLIKKTLQNGIVVDKIKSILENYEITQKLKDLVLENKNFFKSETDFENVIKFISGKTYRVKISSVLDENFFVEFKYPKNLKNLLSYLKAYKMTYNFFGGDLPKLQVKNLER